MSKDASGKPLYESSDTGSLSAFPVPRSWRVGEKIGDSESMHQDWPALAASLSEPLKQLRGSAPDVMKSFSALARAASEAKALDKKTKELVALAISVAIRCEPCITFHAEAAVKCGATREEVQETLGMAIYMGAGPAVMYAAMALEAFDQYQHSSS